MKRLSILIVISSIIFLIIGSIVSYGQVSGKWILPAANELENRTYEVIFPLSGNLSYNVLPFARPYETIGSYGGAYTFNFSDLKFCILGDKIYYGNTINTWLTANSTNQSFISSFRIIPLNSEGTRFHILYGDETTPGHNHILSGQIAELINGNWFFGSLVELGNIFSQWYGANTSYLFSNFTVSTNYDYTHKLFACYGNEQQTDCALVSYDIGANGTDPGTRTIIAIPDAVFPKEAFYAWQLSHKKDGNNTDVFAWCSSSGWNTIYPNLLSWVFVQSGFNKIKFNFPYGPITGVAFSVKEPDVLYIACEGTGTNYTNRGIYRINYLTGAVLGLMSGSADYNRTWLKMAPDGNIYAVRNDGKALGRINQQTGLFEGNVFTFPDNCWLNSYYDIKTNGGSVTHRMFYLPDDNSPLHNITATVQTTYASPCAEDGTATVTVNGGTSPYTYQWFQIVNGQSILMQGYNTNIALNLGPGSYQCVVTDLWGYSATVSFTIGYDPSLVVEDMPYLSGTLTGLIKIFKKGFKVKAGERLTLNNCNFQFMPEAKVIIEEGQVQKRPEQPNNPIIIKSGGLLILNATTFSSVPSCNEHWQGIEVWGLDSVHQVTIEGKCAQGKLQASNSTISDAICAVDLWRPGYYHNTGGIVQATNTNFINNTRAVHAFDYKNYAPNTSPDSLFKIFQDNLSGFINCNFVINSSYIPGNPVKLFYKHIDLCRVNGIKIRGCDFSKPVGNTATTAVYNSAIECYDAGVKIDAPCPDNQISCNNFDNCNFHNFYRGIYANSSNINNFTISVIRANFKNNAIGIFVNGMKNESILFNNFFLGPNYGDNCSDGSPSYGIYLNNSSGFLIEENTFQKAAGAPAGLYTGIAAVWCPSVYDVIYKNSFTGLSEGNYAYGINRSRWDDDHTGISYECNLNSYNTVDFRVTGPHKDTARINGHIGWPNRAAANTFSAPAPGTWHFRNEGRQDIRYYYYGNGNQYPTLIYTEPGPDPYFILIPAPENSCPSHFGNGSSAATENLLVLTQEQKEAAENEYALATSNYNAVKELYDYLKDGGNTEATLLAVETAQPDQMWQLVSDLLAKSPYLSEEVLRAAADQPQVIPEAELFDILAANPDELKNKRLLDYLEQKENPLPGYMIDLLRQVALGSSAKTVLIEQMTEYKAQQVHAVQKLLRSALNDTVLDRVYVRGLLKRLSTPEADEQIAFSYLDEGNIDTAFLVLDSIPEKYGFQGEELASFNAFTDIISFQVQLQQSGRTLYELDSLEVAWLDSYASNDQGKAGSMARAMLEYGGYNHYAHCPELNASWTKQSKPVIQNKEDAGLRLTVNPNPASTWVAFGYELPSGISEATLTLSDARGITLEIIYLTRNRGQWVWDTRKTGSGVYFYRIQAGNRSVSGKFVVR